MYMNSFLLLLFGLVTCTQTPNNSNTPNTSNTHVDGSDVYRHSWGPKNQEYCSLFDELNMIEEEIRVEIQFIVNIERIGNEMKRMIWLMNKFTIKGVNLEAFEDYKSRLDVLYKQRRSELLREELKMENLWFDNDFRISFELILEKKLLVPNPIVMNPRFSEMFAEASSIKDQIMESERAKAKRIVRYLKAINSRADNIDNIFIQTNFYEASQDYLELLDYSADLEKLIKVFETRQTAKNDLTSGIREMRTVSRVNKAVDSGEDWKMRIFGYDGERKVKSDSLYDPILSTAILRGSLPLHKPKPAPLPVSSTDSVVKMLGKYAKYAEAIYKYVSVGALKPKTVIEDIMDDLIIK